MEFSASQLSEILEGTVEGNPDCKVNTLSKIDEGVPHSVSFLYNPDYTHHLYSTQSSVVIVNNTFEAEKEIPNHITLIRVEDARMSFGKLLEAYKQFKTTAKQGIHPTAVIEESAQIGENVYIGALAYIGHNAKVGNNCQIETQSYIGDRVSVGSDCIFHSRVTINEETQIGNHCIIQSGAVIGGDGFGFQPNSENNFTKLIHIGNVILEDHVEVGANTTIDRATVGSTIIRRGVKLDNLIQIGHNVEIDQNTVIASQSGVAGSTYIGKNCMIGGQVGFAGHQRIADGVKIAAKTGIPRDLKEENGVYQGNPAMPIGDFQRSYVFFRKLPKLSNEINELKKELKELRNQQPNNESNGR